MADVDAAAAPAARTKSPTKAAVSGAAAATREPRKRTRSPPPASPKGRSRRELPTHAVEILKAWLTSPQHFHHPYPTQISASRCVEAPSRHRRASSLGMMEVGGFFSFLRPFGPSRETAMLRAGRKTSSPSWPRPVLIKNN